MIHGHGGNIYELAETLGCPYSEIIDMSSNINPIGPPEGLFRYLKRHMERLEGLPEVDSGKAVRAFAEQAGIDPDLVLAGNGTTQFIYTIPPALETKNALILGPTYADYADACLMHHVKYSYFIAEQTRSFKHELSRLKSTIREYDTVFICNPNNPTGALIPAEELKDLCLSHPDIRFIIDEAYLPFANTEGKISMIDSGLSNVAVLTSMSKVFRVPGLRIGFLSSSGKIIQKIGRYALPWSLNSLAQTALDYILREKEQIYNFIKETRRFLETEKKIFSQKFRHTPDIDLFPSMTSFILLKLPEYTASHSLCAHMAQSRILLRDCSNFRGLSDRYIRVSLRARHENLTAAEKILEYIHD